MGLAKALMIHDDIEEIWWYSILEERRCNTSLELIAPKQAVLDNSWPWGTQSKITKYTPQMTAGTTGAYAKLYAPKPCNSKKKYKTMAGKKFTIIMCCVHHLTSSTGVYCCHEGGMQLTKHVIRIKATTSVMDIYVSQATDSKVGVHLSFDL